MVTAQKEKMWPWVWLVVGLLMAIGLLLALQYAVGTLIGAFAVDIDDPTEDPIYSVPPPSPVPRWWIPYPDWARGRPWRLPWRLW